MKDRIMYNQFFENEMTDKLGNNMSITQISYLLTYDSISEIHHMDTENYTQLNQDA